MSSLEQRATGKLPILAPVVGTRPDALPEGVVEALGAFTTAELSDLVGRLHTMNGAVRPLYAGCRGFVATATTVRAPRGDNRAVKTALSHVRPGDVLVVDAQGFTGWCAGGWGMLRNLAPGGDLAALVVDGAYRDVEDFARADLPLYGRATNPATGPKLVAGEIDVPAPVDGVIVHPGDVLVADADGIVVVPHGSAEAVLRAATERRMAHV